MDFRILNEFSVGDVLLDLFHCGEIVVHPVLFAFTGLASCMRNGKSKLVVGEAFHQHFNEGTLSYARRATKDDWLQR